jgi:hypothetical protein
MLESLAVASHPFGSRCHPVAAATFAFYLADPSARLKLVRLPL